MPSYSPTDITNRQEENINDFKYYGQEQHSALQHFLLGPGVLNSTNLLSALSSFPPLSHQCETLFCEEEEH
jgi:hypothetical protein